MIRYMKRQRWPAALAGTLGLVMAAQVQAFSFGDYEAEEQEQAQAQRAAAERRIQRQMSVQCPPQVKNSRIMVALTRTHNGRTNYVSDSSYFGLFNSINEKLRDQGFRTYSPEEIQLQIASAEEQAVLNNDLDAAVAAAAQLQADYTLKASIRTVTQVNRILGIDEVFVTMGFSVLDPQGRTVARAGAKGDSYSDADVVSMAERLVRARARSVVAKLYNGICRHGSQGH